MIPVTILILLPDFLTKDFVHCILARGVSIQLLQHESPFPLVLPLKCMPSIPPCLPFVCHFATMPFCHIKYLAKKWKGW